MGFFCLYHHLAIVTSWMNKDDHDNVKLRKTCSLLQWQEESVVSECAGSKPGKNICKRKCMCNLYKQTRKAKLRVEQVWAQNICIAFLSLLDDYEKLIN